MVVDGALGLGLGLGLVVAVGVGVDGVLALVVRQGLPINPREDLWASPARTCHTALRAA